MKKIILLSVLASLICATSWASKERGGGGAIPLRKAEIASLLEGPTPQVVKKLRELRELGNASIVPDSIRTHYLAVVDNARFEEDLSSPYEIVDSSVSSQKCLAKNPYNANQEIQVPASSELNDIGGKICFDLELLVTDQTTANELVGIAFHEHAHHFGDLDTSHKLAYWAAEVASQIAPLPPRQFPSYSAKTPGNCTLGFTFNSFGTVTINGKVKSGPRVTFEVSCGARFNTRVWIRADVRGNLSISTDINGVVVSSDRRLIGSNESVWGYVAVGSWHWNEYYRLIRTQP